jgi:hypothetical protein
MQLFRRKTVHIVFLVSGIAQNDYATGGNFSRFKKRCDGGPFHLTRPLVAVCCQADSAVK